MKEAHHSQHLYTDHTFFCDLQAMCFTQRRFSSAELREDPNLMKYAGEVLTWRKGRFVSIIEIYSDCMKVCDSSIHELWAWETAQHARRLAQTLGPIAGAALLVYSHEEAEVSETDMLAAVRETRVLYGEAY